MASKNVVGPFIFFIFLMFLLGSCDPGIEDSPDPGILRVTLESDQSDTVIVIVTDTLTVSEEDIFLMSVFQGQVFQDSTYGILYPTLSGTRQEEIFYNLIRRENGQYQRFTIFETYVPPGPYNKIEFGIDTRFLKLKNFDLIEVITPDNYFLELPTSFDVKLNATTEVNVRVKPFQYIIRYRDIYLFQPEMEIVGVNYY
jgi:hypothetical protein